MDTSWIGSPEVCTERLPLRLWLDELTLQVTVTEPSPVPAEGEMVMKSRDSETVQDALDRMDRERLPPELENVSELGVTLSVGVCKVRKLTSLP